MVRQYVPFVAPSQADNDEDDTKPTTMKQSSGDFDLPATSSMAARCTTPNPLNSWILGSLGIPHQVGPRMRHGAQCVLRLVCEEHWTSGLAVGCGSQVLHGFLNYSAIFGRRIPGEPWVSPSVCIYTYTCLYNVYTYIKCLKQILGLPVWIFHTFDSCRVWTLCFNIIISALHPTLSSFIMFHL